MFVLVAMALGAAGPPAAAAAANAAFNLHYVHANIDIPPVQSPPARPCFFLRRAMIDIICDPFTCSHTVHY